jgi:hypothetical protein
MRRRDYPRPPGALHPNRPGAPAAPLAGGRAATQWLNLGRGWVLREVVEAAVHMGERDAAATAFAELREGTQASGTEWARGIEASCAVLLAEGERADALHRAALEHLERGGCGCELGRAELLYGNSCAAREPRRLAGAGCALHQRLSAMGVDSFAERAPQLRATGERAPHSPRRPTSSRPGAHRPARRDQTNRVAARNCFQPSTACAPTSSASSTSPRAASCAA